MSTLSPPESQDWALAQVLGPKASIRKSKKPEASIPFSKRSSEQWLLGTMGHTASAPADML